MKSDPVYSSFLKNVSDTIANEQMCAGGDKVVVAVSGGSDSIALLEVLMRLRERLGIELVVANADHGIRKDESRRDSEFVRQLAKDRGLHFEHEKLDLQKYCSQGLSTEEAARRSRYDFLLTVASNLEANVLATGHTLDDQAETVLLRVIWGCTMAGLCGIYPAREERGVKIVRPLLHAEKSQAISFLQEISTSYCEDSTNADTDYRRNAIRSEVLPKLREMNPNILDILSRIADSIREDYLFLDSVKKSTLADKLSGQEGTAEIAELALFSSAVRREAFKRLFLKAGGDKKKLAYKHWKAVDKLMKSGGQGNSLHLPGDVTVRKTQGRLVFSGKKEVE